MKKILVLTTLLLGAFMVQAQKTADKNSAAYKAAEELMTTMNMSKTVNDAINDMVEMQAQNPMLADKKDALKKFMMKYLSWDVVREDYLNLYATEFTEAELKDMIAFYKTPTGKKLASKMNTLMMKGSELSQKTMQEHMSELMELMKQ